MKLPCWHWNIYSPYPAHTPTLSLHSSSSPYLSSFFCPSQFVLLNILVSFFLFFPSSFYVCIFISFPSTSPSPSFSSFPFFSFSFTFYFSFSLSFFFHFLSLYFSPALISSPSPLLNLILLIFPSV